MGAGRIVSIETPLPQSASGSTTTCRGWRRVALTMPDVSSRALWLSRDDLQRLVDALRAQAGACSDRWCARACCASTRSRRSPSCRRAGRDEQSPGRYRLAQRDDRDELFGVVSGPGALKPHVFAPREPLLQIEMDAASGPGRPFRAEADRARRRAARDPRRARLRSRRTRGAGPRLPRRSLRRSELRGAPRAAVPRSRSAARDSVSTCFCASMDTGPSRAPARATTSR